MRSLCFPNIDDAAELYAIHRFRVREQSRSVVHVPMTRGDDALAFQERDNARTREHWIRRGYYRRVGNDTLRYTLRGALLSAWRGMFPWRYVIERTEARERQAVLRRYGAASRCAASRP
jgi:hypothetical protein